MSNPFKTILRYLHPLNKIHIRISFELYEPGKKEDRARIKERTLHYLHNNPVLKSIFDRARPVQAAELNIIGLEELRKSFGDKWSSIEPQVNAIVTTILKKHLDGIATYEKESNDRYMIVFHKISQRAAQRKCFDIRQDILSTFMTDPVLAEKLSLKMQMVTVGKAAIKTHRGEGKKKTASAAASKKTKTPESKEQDNGLQDRKETVKRERVTAADLVRKPELPQNMEFVLSPVWSNEEKAVTQFRISAKSVFEDEGITLYDYDLIPPGLTGAKTRNLIAKLDEGLMEKIIELIESMSEEEREKPIICPVNYQTISDKETMMHYTQICKKLGIAHKNSLVFEVVDPPKSIESSTILSNMIYIRPFAKHMIVRTVLDRPKGNNLCGIGFIGLSLDISEYHEMDEKALLKNISEFHKTSKEDNFKTYAFNLTDLKTMLGALTIGFDALNGEAICKESTDLDGLNVNPKIEQILKAL